MRTTRYVAIVGVALAALTAPAPRAAPPVDTGAIRLGAPSTAEARPEFDGRRGFDFESFEGRFESLWFARKALLAENREEDAHRQSELIRTFCAEEGIRRLETAGGALIAEARRYADQGSYEKALASLDLAEALDPGRGQIEFARAAILKAGGGGYLEAGREFLKGVRRSLARAAAQWTLANHLAVLAVLAMLGVVGIFSLAMVLKYHAPLRHEVEEWMTRLGAERLGPSMGWALVLLPLATWFLAGWVALYWIVLTFRFMRRAERLGALALLLCTALAAPAFGLAVALYSLTMDPTVRTTLESASGAYSPERLVKLKELVGSHPDDPVYRFLLAGLYTDGRYLEEAYRQYRAVLEVDPSNHQAHLNIGNIYFRLGQYEQAAAAYRQALELEPGSVLAHYNLYLAQSETFRFTDAEQSLRRAQELDPDLAAELLSRHAADGDRLGVMDAGVSVAAVWRAALEGRPLRETLRETARAGGSLRSRLGLAVPLGGGLTVAAVLSGVLCVAMAAASRTEAARRCIRCGRPFCHRCRSGREGHEYCSQCLHLFVIGDGLAPETKTRKLYEVERHEIFRRRGWRLCSLFLPGSAHLHRGFAGRGCVLVFLWVLALVAWGPSLLAPVERLAGLSLRLDMLQPRSVPDVFAVDPSAALAVAAAVVVWLAGNAWVWRRREA